MRPFNTFQVSQLMDQPPDAQIRALGQQVEQLTRAANLVGLSDANNGDKVGSLDAVWLTVQMGAAGQDVTFPHNLKAVPSGILVAQTALDAGELSQPCAVEMMAATDKTITLRATGTNRVLASVTSDINLKNSAAKTLINAVTLPADLLHQGDILKYSWAGTYSTTGTPTLKAFVDLNGSFSFVALSQTTPNNSSGAPFTLEGRLAVRTAGALGTVVHSGIAQIGSTLASMTPASVGSIPINAKLTLNFSLQWGAASNSNTWDQNHLLVELVSASTPTTRLILF